MPRHKQTLKARAPQDSRPRFLPTALLRTVIDDMPGGVAILDRAGRYLAVNAAWKSSTGIGEEALGKTPMDLFDFPLQYSKDLFAAALAGQEVIKTFTPHGEHLGQVTISPWRDDNGEIAGVITRHPVEDRFRQGLEARERRMRVAMGMGKMIAIEVDFRSGEITYEPPTPEGQGIESGGLHSFEDMLVWLPSGESDTFRRLWAQHLLSGEPMAHEFPAVMPGGEISWRRAVIEAVRAFDGEVVGFVGIVQIIDQQKQAEFALIAEKEAAQVADRSKGEFLANMSHEIRTPLTSVLGFTELLGAFENLPPGAQTYIRRISSAGQSLLSVINDILDFSKLEAGQLELDPRPFNAATCVEAVVDLLTVQAADKGLELKLEIAPDLPPWLTADSARIRQVLINLVGNAVKFTDRGDVTVAVRYERTPSEQLHIAVSDTGPGIPDDLRRRIFQRFSQADGSGSRRHGGSGLGLAICKSLVELMGGSIGFDSELGHGSTFWLSIPVAAAAPEAQSETPGDSEGFDARPAHILLVDDVATNRELVRAMLAPMGYSFEEADSGPEAVKAARRSHFDLILMDLQMPGMDGLAAARAIGATAKINRETPILAFSANVLAEQIDAARAAGMVDHISKPIQPAELLTKVAMWTSPPGGEDAEVRRAIS